MLEVNTALAASLAIGLSKTETLDYRTFRSKKDKAPNFNENTVAMLEKSEKRKGSQDGS